MNENHVKEHVRSLFGKKLYTLDRKKPFSVNSIKGNIILITTSTGKPRNVPLQGTIDAYIHIQKLGELTRAEIRDQNYSAWNPAYIAAILASFPEIDYTTKPIRLFKKPKA